MELLIGLGSGLVLFLCSIKAYTIGLQHGKQLSKAEIPKIEINPVQAVKKHVEAKEEKKQTDVIAKEIQNLFSYTGDPQREVNE